MQTTARLLPGIRGSLAAYIPVISSASYILAEERTSVFDTLFIFI